MTNSAVHEIDALEARMKFYSAAGVPPQTVAALDSTKRLAALKAAAATDPEIAALEAVVALHRSAGLSDATIETLGSYERLKALRRRARA